MEIVGDVAKQPGQRTWITLYESAGCMLPRPGVHPNAMDHGQTTRLLESNGMDALEEALAQEDVACVLTEPVLTRVGMVPAAPDFHDALRQLTRASRARREPHHLQRPPGPHGRVPLRARLLVLGKSIAGGIPVVVWGTSKQMAGKIWSPSPAPPVVSTLGGSA